MSTIQISKNMIIEAAKFCGFDDIHENNTKHAFGFSGKLNSNPTVRHNIDLQAWSNSKYSKDFRVILSGNKDTDWIFYNSYNDTYKIRPVVFIAKDKIYDVSSKIDLFLSVFYSNICEFNNWLKKELDGKCFDIQKPIVLTSNKTSKEWYKVYVDQTERFDSLMETIIELRSGLSNRINPNAVFLCTQYNGTEGTWDYDAAAMGNVSFVSSFSGLYQYTAIPKPSSVAATLGYAIGHELLHTAAGGLPHTSQELLKPGQRKEESIMWTARPPEAKLFDHEKRILINSPYIK